MNVFQYRAAIQALLDAHAAGAISNENLSQGGAELEALYNAQPERAKTNPYSDSPRIVASLPTVEELQACAPTVHDIDANFAARASLCSWYRYSMPCAAGAYRVHASHFDSNGKRINREFVTRHSLERFANEIGEPLAQLQ